MGPVQEAKPGDLALYRRDGGYIFAVVRTVDGEGFTKTARGAGGRRVKGEAFAVGPATLCDFDVVAFVEQHPQAFTTPQDAQRAARLCMSDDLPAAKRLDRVLATARP